MALPSRENHHLLWYFEKYLSFNGSMELMSESQHHLPWNRQTCLFVLTYIVQLCSNVDHCEFNPEIMALDEIAKSVHESYIKKQERNDDGERTLSQEACVDEIMKKQREFSEMLVESFMPNVVPNFFKVSKLHQLSVKDKHLNPNEILAAFLDFLLQVLHREENISEDKVQLWGLMRTELSFLLAVLGDIPFQLSHHEIAEEVERHLIEFEILANEAGILVYDCVFHIHLADTDKFEVRANDFLKKVELLNAKIEEHCIKFQQLPLSVISRPGVIDSFFIIRSLIEDIENLMKSRFNNALDDSTKNRIQILHGELTLVQTFINDSEGPVEEKEALIQIRDLAYEVEYLISSYVVGNMHVWYLKVRLPYLIQKIKLAREGLQQNLEMLVGEAIQASDDEVIFRRMEDHVTMDDNDFLDFNSNITQKILEELVRRDKKRDGIISIVGMPGIGKTAMASHLYNCREVSNHFDLRAWCVVPDTYSIRDFFIQILMSVETSPDKYIISRKNAAELSNDVREILHGRRFLIVIDNLWDIFSLGDLDYLPFDGNGSRLLITSQNEHNSFQEYTKRHEVHLQSDVQCWNLLVKKVFNEDPCPAELLSIGERIARGCNGIPLAVVNTAEILVRLEKEISVWETVEEQLDILLLDCQSYRNMLELRYKRLPHYLKPCFLYFATFPKGAEISKDQLARMWSAKGYIQTEEEKSVEATAEMHLSYMISRGFALEAKRGKVRIHDMWHEFCVRKAKEENFQTSTNDFSMYEKHQHLFLPSASSGSSLRPFGLHCRSIIGCSRDQSSTYKTMPLLKVLDVSAQEHSSLPCPHFDLPFQLKYLGVRDLPRGMVDNLVNLESLYVKSNKRVTVPSVILRMSKMRRIVIKPSADFEEDCSISETSNLRSLSFVCIYEQKEEKMLRYLQHLRKLKLMCGGDVKSPDISFLTEIESLKVCCAIISRDTTTILPDFPYYSKMRKLCLSGTVLTGNQMLIIGKLWKLEVLKLEKHTFVGDEWEVRDNEFEELRVLKIESRDLRVFTIQSLDSWFWSSSFIKLECLELTGCPKLEKIPEELSNRMHKMERFEVTKCGVGAYLSVYEALGEDHYDHAVMDKTLEQLSWQDIQVHDNQEALKDPSSMKNLLLYMKELGESSDRIPTGSLLQHVPWNQDTCTFVFYYVLQFFSNLDHYKFRHVVMALDFIARLFMEAPHYYGSHMSLVHKKQRELFSELFVNSFIPEVKKFFKVLKQHQLSDKDKHLNPNEILAAFLDFLIHVLHRHKNSSSGGDKLYALIQNQLSFLLGVLGDIPFQPTHPGFKVQVNNLLVEFEILANELGSFIHSGVFPVRPLDATWLHAETTNLLEKSELMKAKIKHHCIMFSELPRSVLSRSAVVDSVLIIDSLIEDIENLENCETNFIDHGGDGTKHQIGVLKDNLYTSKSVIRVTDQIPRGTYANEVKEVLMQIRDLAYEAEYLVNSHVVGNIPAWYLNLRLSSILKVINNANERLQQLVMKMQDSNVMITIASDGEESSRTLGNASTMHENEFFTFNDDMEENIVTDLIRRYKTSREIILLHGMPGLGKTTTATMLYNRLEISDYFDQRAWCVVSQAYSLRSLFLQILKGIIPPSDKKDLEKETTELRVIIHKTLHRKRYLIVLDDVWDSEVLDKMIQVLPDDENGSRVMVTSRFTGVAPGKSIFHALPLLSDDQSWDLLRKKVFSNPEKPCPWELEGVGKEIARQCYGIPLAVVSTAGILATLEKDTCVWERVAKQLDVLLLKDQSDYKKILELSYEHLPRSLKPCFLYFAAFPEDAEISRKMLTWMWISERFIKEEKDKSLEEIADMYFADLINRSLVLPAKRGWDGGIRTCRIHDLLRDICVSKANGENFVKSSTNDYSMYEEHQHLHLPTAYGIYRRHFGLQCRSLRGCPTDQLSCFQTMPLLKVMDLSPKDSYSSLLHPRFDLPVHLRYLSVGELQGRMLANLVKLEFIHARSKEKVVIPSVILRMEKLKHLMIREEAMFEEDCNVSKELSLRSLSYVQINSEKDENILRHSPHLKKLKCQIGGDEILFPDLTALGELKSLRIDYLYNFSGEILLSEASFPSTIKKLCLKQSKLAWEKMSIIGQLPKLEVLKLEYSAFVGEEWETNDDEFQELRFLKIDMLDLGQWTSESDHFPALEQMVISSCYYLQDIPTDLGYIQTLQRIELSDCTSNSKSSAEEIENEQRENGNTQLQVYASDCRW